MAKRYSGAKASRLRSIVVKRKQRHRLCWLFAAGCALTAGCGGAPETFSGEAANGGDGVVLTMDAEFADVLPENYRIEVISAENWFDSRAPAGPMGLKVKDDDNWIGSMIRAFWKPYLRDKDFGYFVLMGQVISEEKVSKESDEMQVALRSNPFEIGKEVDLRPAPATGELMLFVNDALCPLCPSGTYGLYANNKGTATISVERLE